MSETVILAIGGNALAPAGWEFADQESRARGVAETAVRMIDGASGSSSSTGTARRWAPWPWPRRR